MDGDDDGLDWDEWMLLSPDEQEAIVDREMRAYAHWYAALSLPQQIGHRRRITLDNCRSARRLMRHEHCPQIIVDDARARLKAAQVRLLKVRAWRETGVHPGEA